MSEIRCAYCDRYIAAYVNPEETKRIPIAFCEKACFVENYVDFASRFE